MALQELRDRIDEADERIVPRLRDRVRLPLNGNLYLPGGVSAASMTHAAIAAHEKLLPAYLNLLTGACAPRDDPATYEETVSVDADLLQLVRERIDLGRHVAQTKADADPLLYTLFDYPLVLKSQLTDLEREREVIKAAARAASRYGLDASVTTRFFRWLVEETLAVEVAFLRGALCDERHEERLTIRVDPASELARALTKAAGSPVQLDVNGVHFSVTPVQKVDLWSGHDPEWRCVAQSWQRFRASDAEQTHVVGSDKPPE